MSKVLLEIQNKVALVTINRPDKRNALNEEVRTALWDVLRQIDGNQGLRSVVITGAGDAFVAGADIAAMKGYSPEDALKASRHGSDLFDFLENMRVPTIAAVNGWALGGGCELAIACDFRIASKEAKFGQPEVTIGIIPGYGAMVRLPRLIGIGRAKELIYTGRIIGAEEAERIGLVNRVVEKESLMDEAMTLAGKLGRGPAAIQYSKRAIHKAYDVSTKEGMEFSSRLYAEIYNTKDTKEGICAFLERRKPAFVGS